MFNMTTLQPINHYNQKNGFGAAVNGVAVTGMVGIALSIAAACVVPAWIPKATRPTLSLFAKVTFVPSWFAVLLLTMGIAEKIFATILGKPRIYIGTGRVEDVTRGQYIGFNIFAWIAGPSVAIYVTPKIFSFLHIPFALHGSRNIITFVSVSAVGAIGALPLVWGGIEFIRSIATFSFGSRWAQLDLAEQPRMPDPQVPELTLF